jgi:RimJ/RimL family protein N-acetyltransferase
MNLEDIPVIETPRLRLRGWRAEDFPASHHMWSNPEVVRHITGRPSKRGESWARVLRYTGHWALLGYSFWLIEELQGGAFVGEAGFANFERELEPSLAGIPEIGWALNRQFHGRGYATEAVRAAVAWGDANLPVAKTACIIGPQNTASLGVARKCGYSDWTTADFDGEPTFMLHRPRGG